MNFKIIDCVDYIYISKNERYSSSLDNLFFDGKSAEKANKSGWYKLPCIPKNITVKKPNKQINKRYELKSGYVATELMPQTITMEMYSTDEYDEIIGCYSLKYDEDRWNQNLVFNFASVNLIVKLKMCSYGIQ